MEQLQQQAFPAFILPQLHALSTYRRTFGVVFKPSWIWARDLPAQCCQLNGQAMRAL
jgi:hypothetical protein